MSVLTPACTAHDPRTFDSTDWADHVAARLVCATCPAVAWCHARAVDIATNGYRGGHAPDGTWGGRLWRNGRVVTAPVARGAA